MIIDVYNHILPKKYQEIIDKKVTGRDPNLPSAIWSKTDLAIAPGDVLNH